MGQADLKILVVEDNESLLAGLVSYLRFRGYKEILTAENGMAALQLLKEQPVDFIISDYDMPILDGLRFLRRLRHLDDQQLAATPFVIYSGMDGIMKRNLAKAAMESKAIAWLQKTKDLEELISILEEHANKKAA